MRFRLALLYMLIAVPSWVGAVAEPVYTPKPIPRDSEAYTYKQFNDLRARFYHREIVDEYKRVGNRDPKWDTETVNFLEAFAKYFAEGPQALVTHHSELSTLSRKAKDAGCTDPMFVLCSIRYGSNDPIARQKMIDDFAASEYRKCIARWATRYYPGKMADEHKLTMDWTMASFTDGSYQKGEERLALQILRREDGVENEYENRIFYDDRDYLDIYDSLEKSRNVDTYVKNVLQAAHLIRMAAYARDGAWKITSKSPRWSEYMLYMNDAKQLLAEAYKLHPEYPEASALMIKLAALGLCDKPETARMWLDRALAAQMDYDYAIKLYFNYSLPRWGGSLDDIKQVANECLDTARYDTMVPFMYYEAVNNYLTNKTDGDRTLWRKPETIAQLDRMFDGYIHSGDGRSDYWKTYKAATMYRYGQYTAAKKLFEELDSKVDRALFRSLVQENYDDQKGRILAIGGPLSSEITAAEDFAYNKELSNALAAYKKLATKQTDDGPTRDFVKQRISDLEFDTALSTGDWTSVVMNPDMASWEKGSEWIIGSDGTMESKLSDPNTVNGFPVVLKRVFKSPFEARVNIEFVGEQKAGFLAGIEIRPVPGGSSTSVMCEKATNTISVIDAWGKTKWSTTSTEIKDNNELGLSLEGNELTIYFNKSELNTIVIPIDKSGQLKVGIGYRNNLNGSKVLLRNLQVRQIVEIAPQPFLD